VVIRCPVIFDRPDTAVIKSGLAGQVADTRSLGGDSRVLQSVELSDNA
jgi:hypothetical protein